MKDRIEKYLRGLAGQGDLYFHPNRGNAGDSLIACATFQLFKQIGISCRLIDDASFDACGKIVIFGGGGNLVSGRTEARQFVERHHASAQRLVILPHTISGHEDLLGRLGPNVDVFVREPISFEHVRSYAPQANLFLSDDLAFSLNGDAILPVDRRPVRGVRLKRLVRRERALLCEAIRRSCGSARVLNCFRTDQEKTDVRRPFSNVDASKVFTYGTDTPQQALSATQMVFDLIRRYEQVRTNRLHMAIAGALLGKEVKFYPNNYYKCEAIYRFSMKDRFPNVQWMGAGAIDE